jgi:hypothetical protein
VEVVMAVVAVEVVMLTITMMDNGVDGNSFCCNVYGNNDQRKYVYKLRYETTGYMML